MSYYSAYLRSNHWKELKIDCIASGLFKKCKLCGWKNVQIHHLHYKNKFNEDISKDLVPLCGRCHKKIHEKLKEEGIKNQTMAEFNKMFIKENALQPAEWVSKKKWRRFKKKYL